MALIDVQWLAVQPTTDLLWNDTRLAKYFSVRPHPGITSHFNIPDQYRIVPHALKPTDGFHRLVTRSLAGGTEQPRLPYRAVPLNKGLSCNITAVSGELFPVGVLIARVKAEIEVPLEGDRWDDRLFGQLSSLRNPHALDSIDAILRRVIALARADRTARLGDIRYGHFFAIRVSLPVDRHELTAFVTDRARSLVALLIGTEDPSTLNLGLIDKVVARNAEVNAKSAVEQLLLNRQGMLYFLPIGKYAGPHPNRFEKVVELAMLGEYSKSLLTDAGGVASYWPSYVHLVGGKLRAWIESPNLVFRSSVSNELVWQVLAGALELPAHLKGWRDDLPRVQSPEELAAKLRAVPS